MRSEILRSTGEVRSANLHAPSDAVEHFSLSRLRSNVLLVIGLLLVNKFGMPGNIVCYLILFVMSMKNPEGAIKALSISGLIILASDFFVSHAGPIGMLKFLLLAAAGFTIIRSVHNPFGKTFLQLLLVFGFVAGLLSIYNGYFVEVSLLKNASFIYGAFCLLSIVRLRRNIAPEMLAWAFSLTIVVVALSYAALVIGVGYGSYETVWGGRFSGYRGVFGHPQTLGTMACLFAVFLTTLILFIDFSHRKLAICLLVALLFLLYLSESRTGLLGYFLATGTTLLLAGVGRKTFNERRLLRRYRRQFSAVAFLGLMGLLIVELTSGVVSDRAADFLSKGDSFEEFDTQTLVRARQSQIEDSWENFLDNPWTGIGFGTDLSRGWQRRATLLSASTEKGFLPTAILEETGIIGTVFFVMFVLSLFRYALKTKRYLGLALFAGLIIVNLGEMMFFAFGGMAMLCWPLIAMTMTVSNARLQTFRSWSSA